MDQLTRLKLEIEHNKGLLRRVSSTRYLTDADRRYARTLSDSIARKQELARRLSD